MQSRNVYSDSSCSSVPVSMTLIESSSCISSDCTAGLLDNSTDYYNSTTCPSDAKTYAADTYGNTGYLLMDKYNESTCNTYIGTAVFVTSGVCEYWVNADLGVITTLFSNGTIQLEFFLDSTCSSSSSLWYIITEEVLTSHSCDSSAKFYSNSGGSSTSGTGGSSGVSVGVIVGIAAGVLVLVLLVVGFFICRCRRKKAQRQEPIQTPSTMEQAVMATGQFYQQPVSPVKQGTESATLASSDRKAASQLWDDKVIIAARIPREKVIVQQLINRGGFGEVYAGSYNGQRVAI
ncbi:hypothetical protein BBJ28_00026213, partial [Nothophytophthora sp. Chile5]